MHVMVASLLARIMVITEINVNFNFVTNLSIGFANVEIIQSNHLNYKWQCIIGIGNVKSRIIILNGNVNQIGMVRRFK